MLAKQFAPIRWAVLDVIPEGAILIAGRPKTGKSWLTLNLALAVAQGGVALGSIRVEKGSVLYIALEDGERRLQQRLRAILTTQNAATPSGITFATRWPRSSSGGLNGIDTWLQTHTDARLVIIDTVSRFRDGTSLRGNAYDEDYAAMSALQQLAMEKSIALLAVTHTRKPRKGGEDDPLDEVQNSTGLTAAADAVLVLKRKRFAREAQLFVTGRDIEERNLGLLWVATHCHWQQTSDEDGPDAGLDPNRRAIRQTIRRAGRALGPADLLKDVYISPDAVRQLLSRMQREELLVKEGYGRYNVPDQQSQEYVSHSSQCHTGDDSPPNAERQASVTL